MAKNVKEAERAIISVLLQNGEYAEQILNECRAEMFADPDCRQIFLTAQKLAAQGMHADLSSVYANSEQGFAPKLVEISQTYSIPSNVDTYIATVREAFAFRTAGMQLKQCLDKAQQHDMSCFDDISRLQDVLLYEGNEDECPVARLCADVIDSFGETAKGCTTGFSSLDATLGGGLLSGRLIVMGGRPGMGKSAMALNMAVKAAQKGAVVLYVTLEMTSAELTKRTLYMLSGISEAEVIKTGEPALEKIRKAGESLAQLKLYYWDKGDSSLSSIEGACRRVRAKEERLDLLVIDYVGLMRTEHTKTSTRQQEIAEISRGLKRLAIRMPACVLLLSQLNREADSRVDHIPRLSDLRESGDLEQDADVVLFPVRPFLYEGSGKTDEEASLYVAKNRSGGLGRVDMKWHGPTFTFKEKPSSVRH